MANKRQRKKELQKAVARFNKKVVELTTEENKNYIPKQYDYDILKNTIKGSNEMNRVIRNLNKFNRVDLYITEAEEKITSWERNVLEEEKEIALKRMQNQLQNANKYDKDTIDTLKWNIENIKKLETLKEGNFKDAVARIHRIGVKDYELRKLIQYRENYYKALEEIENYKNFRKFKKMIDRIKDPKEFYEIIQKSSTMSDLFIYYKGNEGIVIGNFATSEEAFNYALENDYNIETEYKDYNIETKYKYVLISIDGTIVAQSDSKQTLQNMRLNSKDKRINMGKIVEND